MPSIPNPFVWDRRPYPPMPLDNLPPRVSRRCPHSANDDKSLCSPHPFLASGPRGPPSVRLPKDDTHLEQGTIDETCLPFSFLLVDLIVDNVSFLLEFVLFLHFTTILSFSTYSAAVSDDVLCPSFFTKIEFLADRHPIHFTHSFYRISQDVCS